MLLDDYQKRVEELLHKARDTQRENVIKAGTMIADSIEQGGNIYLSGICHAIEMDLINRGGGPTFYRKFAWKLDITENNARQRDRSDLDTNMEGLLSTHLIEDIKYLCNEVIIIKSGQILKVAHSNEIASLASGRVYKIPERELSNLKSPFYIENYLIRDNEKNEKIVKVLLLGDISNMEKYSACEVDIEDGYLLILKEKELHAE